MLSYNQTLLTSNSGFLRGLYKWNPASSTWQFKFNPPASVDGNPGDIWDFTIDNLGAIYFVEQSVNHYGGVFRSSDLGETWTNILQTQFMNNPAVIQYWNGCLVAIRNNLGVLLSTNLGISWQSLTNVTGVTNGILPRDLEIGPDGYLYASFYGGGVKRTTDPTMGWSDCSQGLPTAYCSQFTVADGYLFLGTDAGLARLGTFPTIVSQPQSVTTNVGSTVRFSVTATGSAPLGYQWQKDGVSLADVGRVNGATSTNLTITSSQTSDVGNYRVVVTNTIGAVTSVWARLDLLVPPTITTSPATQVVGVGGPATFRVTATGSSPMNYQWYLNGSAIGGANGASYTIPFTSAAWLGSYQVQVWNSAGTNWSAIAGLWLDELKRYAGVNVYGPAGGNCVVQYATNLTAPVTWMPLQSVIIVTNPTVIIDYDSPEQPRRFYRTVPQ